MRVWARVKASASTKIETRRWQWNAKFVNNNSVNLRSGEVVKRWRILEEETEGKNHSVHVVAKVPIAECWARASKKSILVLSPEIREGGRYSTRRTWVAARWIPTITLNYDTMAVRIEVESTESCFHFNTHCFCFLVVYCSPSTGAQSPSQTRPSSTHVENTRNSSTQ